MQSARAPRAAHNKKLRPNTAVYKPWSNYLTTLRHFGLNSSTCPMPRSQADTMHIQGEDPVPLTGHGLPLVAAGYCWLPGQCRHSPRSPFVAAAEVAELEMNWAWRDVDLAKTNGETEGFRRFSCAETTIDWVQTSKDEEKWLRADCADYGKYRWLHVRKGYSATLYQMKNPPSRRVMLKFVTAIHCNILQQRTGQVRLWSVWINFPNASIAIIAIIAN